MTHNAYHGNGTNGNGRRNGGSPADLRRLYAEQLVNIRAAEHRSAAMFPDLAVVAADEDVASVFRAAASDTEIQLARLDQLIRGLELPTDQVAAAGLEGVLDEMQTVLEGDSGGTTRDVDAALLRAAREALRHQIAGYETACATARRLGDYRSLDVLLQSLDEELTTDSSFSRLMSQHSRLARTI